MAYEIIKLLIIDDGTPFTERLVDQCDMCPVGYSIRPRVVGDLEEAGATIRTWRPEVVLFDAHTAIDNCFSLLERWSEAAFVIVTSYRHSAQIEESVLKSGAAAYLVKPSDADDFERLLEEIIRFVPPLPSSH